MDQKSHVGGSRRRISQGLGTWRWHIDISVVALLVIVVVAYLGHQWSRTFWGDFAANFVADAIVAGIAFLLATVAFGYWERRKHEMQAQQKALGILRKDLTHNLREFEVLIKWAGEGAPYFRWQYNDWLPEGRPRLKTASWQLLVQSGLALALAPEVWLTVEDSYATSTEAMTNLYRRASDGVASSDSVWTQLVETCLRQFEEARDIIRDALAKLETGLAQAD
jgi:hypothetical protein